MTQAAGRLGEAEGVEQLGRALLRGGALQAEQPAEQDQVLAAGEVLVHGGELAREAHEPAHGVGLLDDVVPEHARRARIRAQERGEHADRRRLAGPVRTEHAVDGAGAHGEVHAVDGERVAEGLDEAVGLDRERALGGHLAPRLSGLVVMRRPSDRRTCRNSSPGRRTRAIDGPISRANPPMPACGSRTGSGSPHPNHLPRRKGEKSHHRRRRLHGRGPLPRAARTRGGRGQHQEAPQGADHGRHPGAHAHVPAAGERERGQPRRHHARLRRLARICRAAAEARRLQGHARRVPVRALGEARPGHAAARGPARLRRGHRRGAGRLPRGRVLGLGNGHRAARDHERHRPRARG